MDLEGWIGMQRFQTLRDITYKGGTEHSGTAPASSPSKAESSRMHPLLLCLQESWPPPGQAWEVRSTWQLEETSGNIASNIDDIALVLWRDVEELLLFCFNSYRGVVKLSCRVFKDLKDKTTSPKHQRKSVQYHVALEWVACMKYVYWRGWSWHLVFASFVKDHLKISVRCMVCILTSQG